MSLQKIDFTCILKNRSIIAISGNDKEPFLQGIVTQDVKILQNQPIIYSLMLSPQGKFQFDFFIINLKDLWLIDIESPRAQSFLQKLQLFKLRSDVDIRMIDWQVGVSLTKQVYENCFLDPRLEELGYRYYSQKIDFSHQSAYESHCLALGVPRGATDMIVDKSIPLEWGMDELKAISWNKGCYMGQELTARSRYVGQIRKRSFPISFENPGEHTVGDKILSGETEVGELRATKGSLGIALLKLESIGKELHINNNFIKVHQPHWMVLPG